MFGPRGVGCRLEQQFVRRGRLREAGCSSMSFQQTEPRQPTPPDHDSCPTEEGVLNNEGSNRHRQKSSTSENRHDEKRAMCEIELKEKKKRKKNVRHVNITPLEQGSDQKDNQRRGLSKQAMV